MPFLQYTAKTEDTMWSDLEDRESSQSISVQTCTLRRAVTKVLIGWGGGGKSSYVHVLSKSVEIDCF